MLDTSGFETNSDVVGQYARAMVMIRLNGYEFRFHREAADFIPDPKFKLYFWKWKDDIDGDTGLDGTGKHPKSSVRHGSNSATSMDVDPANVAAAAVSRKSVASSLSSGSHMIVVTLLNPYPRTPRGVEIVEKAKRVSLSLIAALARGPHVANVPAAPSSPM
jgi:hypothetical protein